MNEWKFAFFSTVNSIRPAKIVSIFFFHSKQAKQKIWTMNVPPIHKTRKKTRIDRGRKISVNEKFPIKLSLEIFYHHSHPEQNKKKYLGKNL